MIDCTDCGTEGVCLRADARETCKHVQLRDPDPGRQLRVCVACHARIAVCDGCGARARTGPDFTLRHPDWKRWGLDQPGSLAYQNGTGDYTPSVSLRGYVCGNCEIV